MSRGATPRSSSANLSSFMLMFFAFPGLSTTAIAGSAAAAARMGIASGRIVGDFLGEATGRDPWGIGAPPIFIRVASAYRSSRSDFDMQKLMSRSGTPKPSSAVFSSFWLMRCGDWTSWGAFASYFDSNCQRQCSVAVKERRQQRVNDNFR